jgi:methionyl-tRNA synthetase
LPGELDNTIPRLDFAGALMKIWEVVGIANKLIEDSKPWALAKESKTGELVSLLSGLMNALDVVADSIYPFMPATSENIKKQLVKKSTPLFPRIETK